VTQYVNATCDAFHGDDLFENFIAVPRATATFHHSPADALTSGTPRRSGIDLTDLARPKLEPFGDRSNIRR
jgi:hypothetical protein